MNVFKNLKLSEIFSLLLILLLGSILFLYKLESIPSGLYVDEALSGYNAYSIIETGKDEYGKSPPLLFRFFGSYSPPLYTYLTTLPVRLFGLNVFATRFISAISGLIGIVLIYVFLKNLNVINKRSATPLIGALMFCVTPWNVFFARTGYEIYLGFLLSSLGILLIWLGFTRRFFLALGLVVLSLSAYGAHAQKYIVLLFVFGLIIFFRSNIKNKFFYIGILGGLFVQIPQLLIINTPAFLIKNDLFYSDFIYGNALKLANFIPYPLSYFLSLVWSISAKTATYFSPGSLFIYPDDDMQRSIPELSVFYTWMLVPYFFGIYVLWTKLKSVEIRYILLILLVSVMPAALTKDAFSTQRALPLLLPLILIISIGMDSIITKLNIKIWIPLLTLVCLISLVILWRSYFVLLPSERAQIWGYGFKELSYFIKDHPDEKFIIDQSRIKPAYIELAFYLKYPPKDLQQSVDPKIKDNYYSNTEFNGNYNFGNIETRNIDFQKDIYKNQILVGDELAISSKQANEHYLTKVFEIIDPLGFIVFQGFRTDPESKCKSLKAQNEYCTQMK